MRKLEGKIALITGGFGKIGAGIARQFVNEGASVAIQYDADPEQADAVVAEIHACGGKAAAVRADVSRREEIARLFSEVEKVFGKPDVLVNNASICEAVRLSAMTEDHLHRVFNRNVLALILTSQEAAVHFGAGGGTIIHIGSLAGSIPTPEAPAYGASMAAVDAITRTMAVELAPQKIRVNSIRPGVVETDEPQNSWVGNENAFITNHSAMRRAGRVEEIAAAAVFLASPDSSWMTGESLVLSGGFIT